MIFTTKSQGFAECVRALRRGPAILRKELHGAFREAGQDTLKLVKTNVLTMPIRGFRTTARRRFTEDLRGGNIRRRISAVTQMSIRTAGANPRVAFVVYADRLGNARNVPWHLESGKVFRHPIVGNRTRWAGSQGKPWFYREVRTNLRAFEAECEKAIDRTVQALEG